MTDQNEAKEAAQPVDHEWPTHEVSPRTGWLELLGPSGISFFVAALLIGLGLVVASTWAMTANIADGNSGPDNYWHGIYLNYGTLLSPRHEIILRPGGRIHVSAITDPGPPPVDYVPPPTPGQLYATAHRPVYITEGLIGLAAITALFVGVAFLRRQKAAALAARVEKIRVTYEGSSAPSTTGPSPNLQHRSSPSNRTSTFAIRGRPDSLCLRGRQLRGRHPMRFCRLPTSRRQRVDVHRNLTNSNDPDQPAEP